MSIPYETLRRKSEFEDLNAYFDKAQQKFENREFELPKKLLYWGLEIEQYYENRNSERTVNFPDLLPKEVIARATARNLGVGIDGSGPMEFKFPPTTSELLIIKRFNEVVGNHRWKWHNDNGYSGCGPHIHVTPIGMLTRNGVGNQVFGLPQWWAILWNTMVTLIPLTLPIWIFGRFRARGDHYAKPVYIRSNTEMWKWILMSFSSPFFGNSWSSIRHEYGAIIPNRNSKPQLTLEIRLNENHPYWVVPFMQYFNVIVRKSILKGFSVGFNKPLSIKLKNSDYIIKSIYNGLADYRDPYKTLSTTQKIEFYRGREPYLMERGRVYKNGLEFFYEFCKTLLKHFGDGISQINRTEVVKSYMKFVYLNKLLPQDVWAPVKVLKKLEQPDAIDSFCCKVNRENWSISNEYQMRNGSNTRLGERFMENYNHLEIQPGIPITMFRESTIVEDPEISNNVPYVFGSNPDSRLVRTQIPNEIRGTPIPPTNLISRTPNLLKIDFDLIRDRDFAMEMERFYTSLYSLICLYGSSINRQQILSLKEEMILACIDHAGITKITVFVNGYSEIFVETHHLNSTIVVSSRYRSMFDTILDKFITIFNRNNPIQGARGNLTNYRFVMFDSISLSTFAQTSVDIVDRLRSSFHEIKIIIKCFYERMLVFIKSIEQRETFRRELIDFKNSHSNINSITVWYSILGHSISQRFILSHTIFCSANRNRVSLDNEERTYINMFQSIYEKFEHLLLTEPADSEKLKFENYKFVYG